MGVYKGESFTESEWKDKNINAATGKPFGQASEEAVQGKAQDWRNQGSPIPGTKEPEDIRSLGQQLIDWAQTPAGNAVLGGLGLAAASGYGLSRRKTTPETPKAEPYVAPSYDYETTAREVPETKGLPQPSTPVAQTAPAPEPMPTAPTGSPAEQPKFTVSGQVQPQMQYGATNTTAPAGALTPINPVTPPAGVEAAPVQPLTDKQRLEKAKADLAELNLAEAKKAAAAKEAKEAATKLSGTQGVSNPEVEMQKSSIRAKEEKAAEAETRAAVKANPPIKSPVPAPEVTPTSIETQAVTETPKALAEPVKNTNVAAASLLPTEIPAATAEAVTPTTETKAPVIASEEKVAAAVEEGKKRRSSAEVAAENAARPFKSFRNAMVTNLGGNEHPEAARKALSVLKEKVFGGEMVGLEKGKSHPGENWVKAKEYILANPNEFEKPVVDYIQKGAEKARAEASARKAAESQRGGVNPAVFAEGGQKIAGAVKPVLSQAGALVGSEVKGAAAMLPFMLATDVRAQNAGYRREIEQQLKSERNASRISELKAELKKLDEDKYIEALTRRYVNRNIPAELRPK